MELVRRNEEYDLEFEAIILAQSALQWRTHQLARSHQVHGALQGVQDYLVGQKNIGRSIQSYKPQNQLAEWNDWDLGDGSLNKKDLLAKSHFSSGSLPWIFLQHREWSNCQVSKQFLWLPVRRQNSLSTDPAVCYIHTFSPTVLISWGLNKVSKEKTEVIFINPFWLRTSEDVRISTVESVKQMNSPCTSIDSPLRPYLSPPDSLEFELASLEGLNHPS